MPAIRNRADLRRDLSSTLNKHGVDSDTNTADFVLAGYLLDALDALALVNDERVRLSAPPPTTCQKGGVFDTRYGEWCPCIRPPEHEGKCICRHSEAAASVINGEVDE